MTTDTKLKELIINKLTTSQYDSIEEKDPNQIYIVTDAPGFDNTITNCLTHIPQDIKLELNDGVLTLKAGSKVTFTDNTTFTPANDVTYDGVSFNGPCFIFMKNEGKYLFARAISQCMTGTETPTAIISGVSQYFNVNTRKSYFWNGSTWVENLVSFPMGIVTLQASTPYIKSLDQIFNGFGYIGSTVFALPGVKGLIPNGRNADGSLRNTEFTVDKVVTSTVSGTANTMFSLASTGTIYVRNVDYDTKNNLNLSNGTNFPVCVSGEVSVSNGVITSFTPKLPFRAVDQNDFNKLDEEAVKTSGNQIIGGAKTFNNNITLNAQGGNEGAQIDWRTGNQSVLQDTHIRQDILGNLMRFFAKNSTGTNIHPLTLDFETGIVTITTPSVASNSQEAATTSWVNTRLGGTKVTSTELGYLDGVTSAIQTQLNNRITASVSKAQNGYIKFSNGIIIQWGKFTDSGNTVVTFPTAFTTTNYSLGFSYESIFSVTGNVKDMCYTDKKTTGFKSHDMTRNIVKNYIAIGY